MANIANIKTTERDVRIMHPSTGAYVGITVTIMSLDDERLKSVKRKIQDRRLQLDQKGKNFKSEEIDENTFSLLFAAMTGWVWEKDEDGEQATFGDDDRIPEFSRKEVYEVLKATPWLVRQLDSEIGDIEAFFRKSNLI